MVSRWTLLALFLCAGCGPYRSPPARLLYDGLPVSGSRADATRAGFTECMSFTAADLRCRRHNVMIAGQGPYEAAVDMVGGDGSGGFDQITFWSDGDQEEVYKITDVFEQQGWKQCMTGTDERGDQLIYTHPGSPVWIAMDLSYWGKRRLRVIPAWNRRELGCKPGDRSISGALKGMPAKFNRPSAEDATPPTKKGGPAGPPSSSRDGGRP